MNRLRKGIRITVIVVAVALAGFGIQQLFTWYADTMTASILPEMSSVRTTSMDRVAVSLVDADSGTQLRMSVPKAYMVRRRNWAGGPQDSIWIETRLPDLLPAEATPPVVGEPLSAEFARSLEVNGNGIVFHIDNTYVEPGYSFRPAREASLKRFSTDRRSGSSVAYELLEEDFFGLWHYGQLSCTPPQDGAAPSGEVCRDRYIHHYLSKDERKPTVHIYCNVWDLPTLTYRLGCEARTSYEGFGVTYIFRHSQLHRWEDFDSGVRRLLNSFIVDHAVTSTAELRVKRHGVMKTEDLEGVEP